MFYSSLKEQLLEFRKQASWILTEKKLSNQEEPDSYLVPVASCIIMGKKLTLSLSSQGKLFLFSLFCPFSKAA